MKLMHPLEALKILGLSEVKDLSPECIKKEYHKLALKHHPDKGGDAEKFKRLAFAYQSAMHDFSYTKSFIGTVDGPRVNWAEIISSGSWVHISYRT